MELLFKGFNVAPEQILRQNSAQEFLQKMQNFLSFSESLILSSPLIGAAYKAIPQSFLEEKVFNSLLLYSLNEIEIISEDS